MRACVPRLVVTFIAATLAAPTSAVEVLDQTARVSIRVDGLVYTDELAPELPGSLALEQGERAGPGDYAYAELVSLFSPAVIDLSVFADVGRPDHEGQSRADVSLAFAIGRRLDYTLFRGAHARGEGELDHAAFVSLADQNGLIWSSSASAGDVCNDGRRDWQELCFGNTLPAGQYVLTLHAEAYYPGSCGSCFGYARDAHSAVRLEFLVPPEALELDLNGEQHEEVEVARDVRSPLR